MKLTDKDKRAIYESVMTYFKEEVAKRLNETYDRKLAYFFNNKNIIPYDVIKFDDDGEVEFKRLNNQWLGSITDEGSFVLEVGKTYSYKDVFKRIDDGEFNRKYSKSLLHSISLVAKMWNLNIVDWIWNDHTYNQSIKLNKETFDARVTRIVKNKNGRIIDFDFVINKMELVRSGVSSEYFNILCGDASNPSNLKAIVYLTIDMYNKLENIRRSRYETKMSRYKDPLIKASETRFHKVHAYGETGTYEEQYRDMLAYFNWCVDNKLNMRQYEQGKLWNDEVIKLAMNDRYKGNSYVEDTFDKMFFVWLKKKHSDFYEKIKPYLDLD